MKEHLTYFSGKERKEKPRIYMSGSRASKTT
jgi:hypothetical protein